MVNVIYDWYCFSFFFFSLRVRDTFRETEKERERERRIYNWLPLGMAECYTSEFVQSSYDTCFFYLCLIPLVFWAVLVYMFDSGYADIP